MVEVIWAPYSTNRNPSRTSRTHLVPVGASRTTGADLVPHLVPDLVPKGVEAVRVLYNRPVLMTESSLFTEIYHWMDLKICLLEPLVPGGNFVPIGSSKSQRRSRTAGNGKATLLTKKATPDDQKDNS